MYAEDNTEEDIANVMKRPTAAQLAKTMSRWEQMEALRADDMNFKGVSRRRASKGNFSWHPIDSHSFSIHANRNGISGFHHEPPKSQLARPFLIPT
jgi:hypothetical protein